MPGARGSDQRPVWCLKKATESLEKGLEKVKSAAVR
jgi:hypothetical protein